MTPAAVKRGPGRPRKVRAPVDTAAADAAASLAVQCKAALARALQARYLAAATFEANPNVAHKIALQVAEIVLAGAWVAHLQVEGNHTHALKYSELGVKWSAQHADSLYLTGLDHLEALEKVKLRPQGALGKKGKK